MLYLNFNLLRELQNSERGKILPLFFVKNMLYFHPSVNKGNMLKYKDKIKKNGERTTSIINETIISKVLFRNKENLFFLKTS